MNLIKVNGFLIILFNIFGLISNFSLAGDPLQSLRETYRIENDCLITVQGQKYNRYPFESKFHFNLAYYLKDVKAASIIHTAYKKHILPVIFRLDERGEAGEAEEIFAKAFIKVCLLFGSPNSSPLESFFQVLKHEGTYGSKWVQEYAKEIQNFVKEANVPLYTYAHKKESELFTIVIITTTASGGNHAAAQSMIAHLSQNPKIKAILLDVEDLAREHDPIMVATNTYTYDMIYSAIFQNTNNFEIMSGRSELNREIQQYISNNLLAELKQKVITLNPDLIISTRSYTSDDIALASLGIPFAMFHPDFKLSSSLYNYYKHSVGSSIQFWLPTGHATMFKPLFETSQCLNQYDENDTYDVLLEKMSTILEIPLRIFKTQFEVVGYPCSNFFKINDESILSNLKQKWEIKEHEIPVFIVMGKHGATGLKEIFNHLLHSPTKLPLKYIFICGKNDSLKDELMRKVLNSSVELDKIAIYGLLSPDEMNEVMNISSLGISKAGGGTVIESLATQRHLLLMHSYPWEEVNGSFLIRLGLATKYDSSKTLIEQIENYVMTVPLNSKDLAPLENWQEKLMSLVHFHMNRTNSNI